MQNLIVLSDVQKYKTIYRAFEAELDIEAYIEEAQLLDLKQWLGDALLMQLIEQRRTNSLTPENKLLIYGGTYTYDNRTCHVEGLCAALAYYTYARFVIRSSAKATQFGMVTKTDNYSEPVSDAKLSKMKGESVEAAEAYKQDVILLLTRKPEDYPLYASCKSSSKRKQKIRIIGQ